MITQDQYDTIIAFKELDQARFARIEVAEGVKAIRLALRQLLAKDRVYSEDFFQLEEALPGTTAICAHEIGYSEAEFCQQLAQGLVLELRLRKGLETILTTVF